MTPYVDKKRLACDSANAPTVIFIYLLFCYEYYAFFFVFLKQLAQIETATAVIFFIEMHFFVIMMMWFYTKAVFTGPGFLAPNINDSFSNVEEIRTNQEKVVKYKFNNKNESRVEDTERGPDDEKIMRLANDPILQLQEMGYCFKCNRVKIPRSHHCKQCGRCVIRMDHHCPWVGNCVGLHNHKYFIGFLCYTLLTLLQVFFIELNYFLLDSGNFKASLTSTTEATLIQINCMSCLGLAVAVSILCGFQVYAALHNVTTVEYHIKDIMQRNPFDKHSAVRNLEDIFGSEHYNWWLPVPPRLKSEEELFLLRGY